MNGTGFVVFGDCMNILQVSKVKVVDTPIVDTRLVLNWTPSSTTCSTSHWLPQSALQLPLVTFETLCWNRKHVLSNLGSLTGVYSCFSSCQRRVAVTFGCAYLICQCCWRSPHKHTCRNSDEGHQAWAQPLVTFGCSLGTKVTRGWYPSMVPLVTLMVQISLQV
jgi:hypothetical protein